MQCNRCGKDLIENEVTTSIKVDYRCYGKVNHTKNLTLCDNCNSTFLLMFNQITPPPILINNPEPDKTTDRPTR